MRPKFKLTLLLALTVIAFTVIGTLTHELGHAAVAWYYGLKPTVHYQFTDPGGNLFDPRMTGLADGYGSEIRAGRPFPNDTLYRRLEAEGRRKIVAFIWGGPTETMLSGTLGFALLLSQWRRFRTAERLSAGQWLILFLTLCWLRQPANLLAGIAQRIVTGRYSAGDDDSRLSIYYGLPVWGILVITTIIATAICFVVYRAIPPAQRGSFLLAFIIGAPLGYGLWLFWPGPVVMP